MAQTAPKEVTSGLGVSSQVSSQAGKMHTQSKSSRTFSGPSHFRPAPWDFHFQPPCLLKFSVENRIMSLEGHSARVVMLRAEARCIAKIHFPSTPPDRSLPTPYGFIQIEEEPESTGLCCSHTLHAPGHLPSPSSFLPTRVSSSLLLTGPSIVAHALSFSSLSPSFPSPPSPAPCLFPICLMGNGLA